MKSMGHFRLAQSLLTIVTNSMNEKPIRISGDVAFIYASRKHGPVKMWVRYLRMYIYILHTSMLGCILRSIALKGLISNHFDKRKVIVNLVSLYTMAFIHTYYHH